MVDIDKIQESLGIEISNEIINQDGDIVPVDGEKLNKALQIVSEVRMDLCRISRRISEFFDEELYQLFGISKQQAAEQLFGMSISTVQNMQLIHRRLGNAYEELEFLGSGKLKAISNLPEEQRAELIEDGVLNLADGSQLTIDEIAQTKTKELEKKLKAQKLQNSRLKNELEEFQKESDAEIKQLNKEIKDLDNLVNISAEEKSFHKRITKTRETQNQILAIQTNFHAAFAQLSQIELTEENKSAAPEIEGLLSGLARQILQFEAHFDLDLGSIKKELAI